MAMTTNNSIKVKPAEIRTEPDPGTGLRLILFMGGCFEGCRLPAGMQGETAPPSPREQADVNQSSPLL
jgi:hypothetical protein